MFKRDLRSIHECALLIVRIMIRFYALFFSLDLVGMCFDEYFSPYQITINVDAAKLCPMTKNMRGDRLQAKCLNNCRCFFI